MMSGTLTSISTSRAVILGWLEKEMICSLDVSRVSVAIAVVLAYSLFVTLLFFSIFFYLIFFLLLLFILSVLSRSFASSSFFRFFLIPESGISCAVSPFPISSLSYFSQSLFPPPISLNLSSLSITLWLSVMRALSLFQYLSCFPTLH